MMVQIPGGSCESSILISIRSGRQDAVSYHYGWERIRSSSTLEPVHNSIWKGAEAWALFWRKAKEIVEDILA